MENMTIKRKNVFQNKNFSLLFGGVLVSNIAHILFNFAISLFILRVANSAYGKETAAMIQALYLALSGIVLVILMPFGGVLADKLNKVRIMYITDFIRGFTIIFVGLFLVFVDDVVLRIVVLFVMNLVLSVNSSIFQPASSSLLRFIVSDEELQPAAAYLQGSSSFQAIIGLVLGGVLYATVGIVWIFFINGVGYVISAISEMFIRYNHHEHASSDISMRIVLRDIREGLSYIFHAKPIFVTLMMALGLNFFLSPIFSNALPYFIEFDLGASTNYLFSSFLKPENWYSIISVSLSISAIIMSLILSRQKTKDSYGKDLKRAILIFVLLMCALATVMVGFYLGFVSISAVLVGLTLIMFLLGFANTAFNIPVNLIFQRKVDKKQLGKVSSVSGVLSQALIPIASLIAGVLISQISINAIYLFALVGMVLVTIFYVTNKQASEI